VVGCATGGLGVCIGSFFVCGAGVMGFISAVGLPFGVGGACIVATTSAHVSFAGVFLVAYSAT
jgi:hypothetical protein